jgi:ParB family chromosome partitioning protein
MARKPGLGKGLGALIPEGEATEVTVSTPTEGPLRRVPVASIRPNPFQPRKAFSDDSLQTLASSVRELGVLQPLIVRAVDGEPDMFELIAGERRWRAAIIAELELVPVLVQIDVNDRLSLEQAVVENLHRVDLHSLEEAAAYQQLIDEFDLTHEQVAQRVGKSRANVTNTLRLLQLGETAQSALATSQITAGHARSLLAISDPNAQSTMVARVIKNELSVRATEEAVKTFLEPRPPAEVEPTVKPGGGAPRLRPVPDASVAELEHLLEDYLDTRVHVDLKGRNGRIIIDFADLDDLERIYIAISNPS